MTATYDKQHALLTISHTNRLNHSTKLMVTIDVHEVSDHISDEDRRDLVRALLSDAEHAALDAAGL